MFDDRRDFGARGNLLLWWRVDDASLRRQVKGYQTLKIHESARGQSTLLLLLSAAITGVGIIANPANRVALLDVAVFLVLAVLIYAGQRWAMMAAMVLWTFEKIVAIADHLTVTGAGAIVGAVIFWLVYMRAFHLAWRVEGERKTPPADLTVFD